MVEPVSIFRRAGGANFALPVIAILLFLLVKAFSLKAAQRILLAGFALFTLFIGLRSYVTTLARVLQGCCNGG
jgi:hypothetical protein